MKKVLHRGFKPAKCKTALQMANSRLKILKNKKEIQIKQLRRELAQLLEAGNTPTARIRVEHVVREEKTVAAYELIGIYCELLVVRLGVIESQKNCPIDLKEAVASVLFASQRLSSDVPELSEIVKQFTTKYGKDFATSAIELRPDSGVSRLLVEKLSAKAPDGPTKVKILVEIAAEHNVVWEAKSFVEPDPRDQLLSGTSSFQSASSVNVDSSRIPNKEQPPNVQAPATVNVQRGSSEIHHSSENSYYASDGRSSSRSNNVTCGNDDDYHHPNARPSRSTTDEGERRNPNHGDENSSSRSKHRWETEFYDSTEAARAAAEAAERASFAARAAAELSSKERMTRQNSSESHVSSASVNFRNEPSHRRNRSNVQSESFSEEHFSPRGNVRKQYEDMDRTRQDRYGRAKESEIPPLHQQSERHSLENLRKSGSFGQTGREKQPSEHETDFNVGYSEDAHLRKQSSRASSHSHSSNYSDENVLGSDYTKSPSHVDENIFATEYDHQSQKSFQNIDSHDHGHHDASADTFDDYNSFSDKPTFDAEDEYDHGVGFSLLGSKTPTPSASWSAKGDHSKSHGNHSSSSQVSPCSPLFDDVSTSPPASYHEPDPHAKFDSYGPDSESDDDQPRHRGKVSGGLDERVNLTSDRSQKFQVSNPVGRGFFPLDTNEHEDDSRSREESDSEADDQTGLNFRPLMGGFRNRKTLPPYRMGLARNEASSKSEKEHNETDDVMSTFSNNRKDIYTKKASNNERTSSTTPPHPSSSDDDDSEVQLRGRTETRPQASYRHSQVSHDDSEEELPKRASFRSQVRTDKPTTGMRDYNRANLKTPAPTSHEDEEEVGRYAAQVNAKPTKTAGISLRTKGQGKAHEKRSFPVTTTKTDKESHDQTTPKHKTVTSSPVPQTVKSPDPETPSRERASHVHPNLPDYDDIFAKLGALRAPKNR
ncbi:hypothetical protein EUTSA_v10001901mg [Eutrema salsugineum]|uniref:IST1-like protein n=1 Tax=Eutrema salsugineum TaxID=72664 RepID=V4NUB3_EUTSA|nr:uncharacterized protein LOC18025767 [Eutrema salsugineum]ESQ50341.1 hypothetical protein EUTSA_v10001901mg [Eutrema salsugineum]